MLGNRGGKTIQCVRPSVLLLALFLLIPSASFGEAIDFLPSIYSSQGDFEMSMMRQSAQNTAGGQGSRSSDLYAVERLRLRLNGYVYHPRFVTFFIKGASGFSQERYDNKLGGSFSETAVATDYEVRTKLLPEHPYNIELYALSSTPLRHGQASQETRSTNIERGAIFDYGFKPIFFNLAGIVGENKTRLSSANYRTMHASAAYSGRYLVLNGGHTQTDSSTSTGMHASNEYSFIGNTLKLGTAVLSGRVSDKNLIHSRPASADLENNSFNWNEQLTVKLPWNFSTSASYNFQKDERTSSQATAAAPDRKDTSETKTSNFTLAHSLYDSVRTSYGLTETTSESSFGNIENQSQTLNGVYTKKLPDGRISVGGQAMYSLVNQENALLIMGETYNARLFDTFTLSRQEIDAATVSIKVIDNIGMFVDLVENTHYIVQQAGNLVNITIVWLPPQVTAGHPINYAYTFQATFNLLNRTVELETSGLRYNIHLMLFNNLLNPYYSHEYISQVVLSGFVPGGDQETDSRTIGINIQKAPYALTTEERITDSRISPSRALRNVMEYSQRMSDTLNMTAQAEVTRTVYGEGTLGSLGYTERVSSLNFLITKSIPLENIIASASSTYMKREAIRQTEMYSLRGSLTWKLGAFFVNMEASVSRSETTGGGLTQTMLSDLFYLTLSRKLF